MLGCGTEKHPRMPRRRVLAASLSTSTHVHTPHTDTPTHAAITPPHTGPPHTPTAAALVGARAAALGFGTTTAPQRGRQKN